MDTEVVNYADLLFNGTPPPAWQTEIMRRFATMLDEDTAKEADPRQLSLF